MSGANKLHDQQMQEKINGFDIVKETINEESISKYSSDNSNRRHDSGIKISSSESISESFHSSKHKD